MPSQGPNNGSSFTSSGTPAWSNPGNAQLSDNSYATVSLASGQTSGSLLATGFGFTLPGSAIVTGVVVEVEGEVNVGGSGAIWRVYLLVGGTRTGTQREATIPTTEGYVTLGSSTDLWGISNLTPTGVNGTGFGAEIIAVAASGKSASVSLDHVRITVYYEIGGFFYQSVII
jgi:hypothetical protein